MSLSSIKGRFLKMKKNPVIVFVSLAFLLIACVLYVLKTNRDRNELNETYDFLISRIIVTDEEKFILEDLEDLIKSGESSDYAENKKTEFIKLFNKRHYSDEPIDSIEMYLKDESLIFCIPYKWDKYNTMIEFAYEFKVNGEFAKVATFIFNHHYYTVRNNRNDHIIKILAKDSLFDIRERYIHD